MNVRIMLNRADDLLTFIGEYGGSVNPAGWVVLSGLSRRDLQRLAEDDRVCTLSRF